MRTEQEVKEKWVAGVESMAEGITKAFAEMNDKMQKLSLSLRQLDAKEEELTNPMSKEKIRRAKLRKKKRKNGGPR